jgi:TRAP-type transport system periplasmic protein
MDKAMHRRLARRYFLGAFGALAGGPSASKAIAAETFTMRMSLPESATSVLGMTALHFAAAVERRSNGQLKVEVYPSYQLVKQAEIVSGLVSGVLDLAIQGSAVVVPALPQFQVFDTPFLFRNVASAYRAVDGPIGNELFALLESKGIIGLGWGTGGFKELSTTTKAVTVPEDMKGMRVRIQSGAVYVATYQALGAIPVTIDAAESFIALQQHVVEGVDLNLDSITTGKFYTVIRHVALSHHIFVVSLLMGSKRKIDTLPLALQRILREEGRALVPFWRSLTAQQIADDVVVLKKNGVAFTEIQYPLFRKAVEPVYAMIQAQLGGSLLERVSRAAGV